MTPAAPHPLALLRRRQGLSQLELGLRAGVSQRHLSCIETGRARPSRATLLALLDTLDAPLTERNAVLLAAGLAPAYRETPWAQAPLAAAREAIAQLLNAPGAAPALVIDAEWQLLMANAGVARLLALLGVPMPALPGTNLLDWLLGDGPFQRCLLNPDEVRAALHARAQREARQLPALARRLAGLGSPPPRPLAGSGGAAPPLLCTALRAQDGRCLRLFSMFTSFGSPLDVTLASLRIEHLCPADAATAEALGAA